MGHLFGVLGPLVPHGCPMAPSMCGRRCRREPSPAPLGSFPETVGNDTGCSSEGVSQMWDFRPLRVDVERLFGRDQVELVQPCLNSIHAWRGYARYHFSEAKRLMAEGVGDRPHHEMVGVMLGVFDKEDGDFEWARFQAAAHITACVHAMHSLADVIGQTLYLGLGMNLDPALAFKEERRVRIGSVADRLPPGPLADQASVLVKHEDFVYLAAMNNHSKHRSVVPVGFSVDFTGEDEETHGLKFNAFQYDEKSYPARWVRSTLIAEYQRQETLLHGIGNALNAELAART